ncbi:metallo-beta-lactamase domain-containing protein 1 [Eurytemora carolleeae]|uniref:metallo-beta-lactamase domain-containing protein 1 n=1 Tax=Eurytemora carolleeae TaxID=1294199 RepID=UPI000C75AEEE|nr:metallo-beta-lactamase domain-containing protein 1 [Eurytemora carolleeae]|eukprot:XP_023335549.1 metallo-beta-lactamase domain-containing protein 1-like [Eurytemora affinis]
MYEVHVLAEGYSKLREDGIMTANGSCSLVTGGKFKVVVDTMSPWDKEKIIEGLKQFNMSPEDITHLVCTHGHPDHVGNNNLFTAAVQHIVGFSVHKKDEYFIHPFECGEPLELDGEDLVVIPTPGHTNDSVSLKVLTKDGVVVIAGDLFEKQEDLTDDKIWKDAGSENEAAQKMNREKILSIADFIVPGHGPKFQVKKL